MKNIRTIALTVGIGSAVAWLVSNKVRRNSLKTSGKTAIRAIRKKFKTSEDRSIRYI